MYHFTDLPSFVSGDYLVAFDPHAAYLGGEKKGMKIAFEKMRLADKFPDTTAPFLHFGCTMREHYRGTLFRFPLRCTPCKQPAFLLAGNNPPFLVDLPERGEGVIDNG